MSLSLRTLESHIIDLQIRYTHQEDTIKALDGVVQHKRKLASQI